MADSRAHITITTDTSPARAAIEAAQWAVAVSYLAQLVLPSEVRVDNEQRTLTLTAAGLVDFVKLLRAQEAWAGEQRAEKERLLEEAVRDQQEIQRLRERLAKAEAPPY